MALKQIIGQVEDLSLVKECETAMEAYNVLQKESVDLLFLDIEMPGITGLELARQLKDKKAFIIFTTGKSEYAIDAFDMNVADYLIKPISMSRFLQAIEKFKELWNTKTGVSKAGEADFFFVKDKGVMNKISLDDILYFEAMGDYVKVHVNQQSYMVHSTLKTIEQKIDPSAFLRVHRSYIISLNKIDRIEDGVVMIQKNGIPVADAYRPVLNQKIRFL